MTAKNYVLVSVGVIFTLAGYFGPEDGGLLMLIGLSVLAWGFFS